MAIVCKMRLNDVEQTSGLKTRVRDDGEQVVLATDGQWYAHRDTRPEGVELVSGEVGREKLRFAAVTSGSPDDPNKAWSAATPSGMVELLITNSDAHGQFKVGDEVYVEIRKARK